MLYIITNNWAKDTAISKPLDDLMHYNEIGIERLLDMGAYSAAFPIHDGNYYIKPKGDPINYRQVSTCLFVCLFVYTFSKLYCIFHSSRLCFVSGLVLGLSIRDSLWMRSGIPINKQCC